MADILIPILCGLLMLVGAIGIILPILPGLPLVWAGLFIYALTTDFSDISTTTIIVFLILSALSMLFDAIAPLIGAKKYKASKFGIIGTFVGFIIGIFTFGPVGIILGPLLGAFVGELLSAKRPDQAFGSALGAFVGFIFGTLVKMVIAFTMIGFFISALL